MGLETEYILAANFGSDDDVLELDQRSWIVLRSSVEYEERVPKPVREAVTPTELPDCVIVREYYSKHAVELEELLFLLRLFKTGDIIFLDRMVVDVDGQIKHMYPYSPAISPYYPGRTYELSKDDILEFDTFCREVTAAEGYEALWMRIARRYFLWGGSKDFNAARDNERLVDYMTALEATLITERDYVRRRLARRAGKIVSPEDDGDRAAAERAFRKLYDIRSTIVHGSTLRRSAIEYLKSEMIFMEESIRLILKHTLERCGQDKDARREYLKSLGDISDADKAEDVISRFRSIQDSSAKEHVRNEVCGQESSQQSSVRQVSDDENQE